MNQGAQVLMMQRYTTAQVPPRFCEGADLIKDGSVFAIRRTIGNTLLYGRAMTQVSPFDDEWRTITNSQLDWVSYISYTIRMPKIPRILSVSLPPQMVELVKKKAREERRTISEIAREALRQYLAMPATGALPNSEGDKLQ